MSETPQTGPAGWPTQNVLSRLASGALFALAISYGMGTLSAIALFARAARTAESRTAFLTRAIVYGFVVVGSVVTLAIARRWQRCANITALITVAFTTFIATKAIVGGLVSGFKRYHLVEPIVVMPCVFVITANACLSILKKQK